MPGAVRGKMPFDDSDVYKLIEGASLAWLQAPDEKAASALDGIIAIVKTGQEEDGYLTTWFTIDPGRPPAPWVGKSGRRWADEAGSHELYNSGHLFEAAAAHHLATGKRNLLDIAVRNADLLLKNFGPGRMTIPPGHQIVEQGLISLYRIAQDKRYLKLARYFLELRGRPETHPSYGAYAQDHLPVLRQREVVGHAVRAVYQYAALTDMAAVDRDRRYRRAVLALWSDLVKYKTYLTGGLGAQHEGESLGRRFELPDASAYAETCAAIGSVYWNDRLFRLTGDGRYYDLLERTLYNGVLAGMGLEGKSFFYVNPLEADGRFAFNHGATGRRDWFDCPCCVTNLIRFLPALPAFVYAVRGESLYVNLYAGSTVKVKLGKAGCALTQETDYPWSGSVRLRVTPDRPARFTLRLRIPGWARNEVMPGSLYRYADKATERPVIKINGRALRSRLHQGYAVLRRRGRHEGVAAPRLRAAPTDAASFTGRALRIQRLFA